MRHNYLLLLLMLLGISSFAQQAIEITTTGKRTAPMLEQPSPDYQYVQEPGIPPSPIANRTPLETQIGVTRFELQTIASLGKRVAVFEDGTVSAAWLHGLDQTGGWPDRGTAYNYNDGSAWGAIPTESLEVIRAGYPSFTNTPSGVEVVISHKSETGSLWILHTHTKMPGETSWSETDIPSTVTGGPVWPKIATGGPDGNTIHGFAVSVDPMFGGSVYQGMDQHPLYFRSLDAGQTWDKVDVIIPGLDSNFYDNIFGEGYNIDANGDVVAVGVFDSWGDVAIAKSTDNGESWEKTIVHDFPLDKYDGMGYTADDIPFDPNAPDSISILTADYSGSVLVDNNGKVHVFFGLMYVYASGADQFLYLDTGGIGYWNEDFGPDSVQIIASLEDFDGDGMVTLTGDLAALRYNNTGLLSFPSSGVDEEGNIYLTYMAMREDISFEDNNYRHIFIIKSEDGGETWSAPFDLINTETTDFPEFIEASYASIPSRISGNAINMVYHQDLNPGLTPTGGTALDQLVMHVPFDKNTFGMVSDIETITYYKSEIAITPNPAKGQVQLTYNLLQTADVQFSIFDAMGKRLMERSEGILPAGEQVRNLDISNLQSGIYFVVLTVDGVVRSEKLVVK